MRKLKSIYLIIIGLAVMLGLVFLILKKKDYTKFAYQCDEILTGLLNQNGIDDKKLLQQTHQQIRTFRLKAEFLQKEFLVPEGQQLQDLKEKIARKIFSTKFSLGRIQSKKSKTEQLLVFDFYFKKLKLYRLILKQKIISGKLAIVLDDWGYQKKLFNASLNLKIPITFAILPNLAFSQEIADKLHKLRYEYILHLPLEPHAAQENTLRFEKNTILTTMKSEEILQILKQDLANISSAKGINNHMGSLATEDEYVMGIIFAELKNRNLYFLDSFVSDKSICEKVAGEKNIHFLKRDVFMDNIADIKQIKKQLQNAKQISLGKGYAIAIGHARTLTISALKEVIPQFQKEGIKFVSLSELFKEK